MMGKLTKELRERLDRLSTTNVSDALDALGLKGSTYGVNKMYEGCEKIIGEAVTMKVVAAGLTKSTTHMGVNAIEVAKEGDVIVIDNGGRIDVNCWGGVLSTAPNIRACPAWSSTAPAATSTSASRWASRSTRAPPSARPPAAA